MTVTLTTDHGTFEAPTAAEATKAAAKAQRAAERAEKQSAANRALAYERAERAAYRIYRAWHTREGKDALMGGRWDVVTPDSPADVRRIWWRVQPTDDGRYWSVAIKTTDGDGILRFFRDHEPLALLYDAAGYLMGGFVRDGDRGTIQPFAVGVANGVVAIANMPGIDYRDLPAA